MPPPGLQGPKGAKKKLPPSPAAKQAIVWAAKQNLKPWEVPSLPPSKPVSVVFTKKAAKEQETRLPPTPSKTLVKAAVAAPVNAPIKVGKKTVPAREVVAKSMTPQEIRRYHRSYTPPSPPVHQSLLERLLSRPVERLHQAEAIGRTIGRVGGAVISQPVNYLSNELAPLGAAVAPFHQRPQRPSPYLPPVPPAVQAGAIGMDIGREAAKQYVGRAGYNLVTRGDFGHPIAAGLELAAVVPGVAQVPKVGRAIAEGLLAARLAEDATKGRAAFKAAYEASIGGPMLPARVLRAASVNRVVTGQALRGNVHAVIDQVVGDRLLAKQMKAEADGHAHLASLAETGIQAKREAAKQVFQDYLTSVQHMPEHPIAGMQANVDPAKGLRNVKMAANEAKIAAEGPKSRVAFSTHVFKPGEPQVNAAGQQLVEASGHQVVGEITPEEWWRRVQHAVGNDKTLGLSLAHWYRDLGPLFRTIFGKDGDAVLRSFATSQANASPAGGLLNVLRVRDKILNHERISKNEISTVVKTMEAAYKGEPIQKGLGAKLHDFIASLEGKKTRSWTLDDVKGGLPAAIDVHAARDLGWIDKKILATLRTRHGLPVAHLQLQKLEEDLKLLNGRLARGKPKKSKIPDEAWKADQEAAIAKKKAQIEAFTKKNKKAISEGRKSGLVLDNPGGSPSGYRYEAGRIRYEQIVEHLNQIQAWGKTDWTPAEAQALGWSAIQRIHGTVPEDAMFAAQRNTYTLALETLNEHTVMGLNSFTAQMGVTREAVDRILPQLVEQEHGKLIDLNYGSGGWHNTVMPAAQIKVVASPEQIDRMVIRLANMFDQADVWGVRVGVTISKRPGAGLGRAALEITGAELADPARVGVFWHRLQEVLPENLRRHVQGYSTFTRDGKTGIRIITEAGPVAEKNQQTWASQFAQAIQEAGKNAGFTEKLVYASTNVEVRSVEIARASRRVRGTLRRAGRLPGMGDPLEAEARQTLGQALARWRDAEGGVSPGAATEFRRSGFEPGPTHTQAGWMRAHPYRTPSGPGAAGYELPVTPARAPRGVPQPERVSPGGVVLPSGTRSVQPPPIPVPPPPLSGQEAQRVIREAIPGMPGTYNLQEAKRSAERSVRVAAGEEAMKEGGKAGFYGAMKELQGEYPKLTFKGFDRLDDASVTRLFDQIQTHPYLKFFEKIRVQQAILGGMMGKVPPPSDRALLERVFGKGVMDKLKPQALDNWQKAGRFAMEAWNVPRSLLASFDLSAPFRQGLMVAVTHPKLFFGNFEAMIHAFGSEKVYQGIMSEIESRPTYGLMQEAGLALTDLEDLSHREEQFMSNMAERIPIVGKGVRSSGRAYTAFLNKTRADYFDLMLERAHSAGIDVSDEQFLKGLGGFINSATGRGGLGKVEDWGPFLNSVFFSPRLLASRMSYLNPVAYVDPRIDPLIRQERLRGALGLVGAMATVLGIAKLAGAKVGIDPRSADFAKIRIGNTRIDLAGGFLPPIRLLAQLGSRKIVSSTTGKTLTLGPSGPGKLSDYDIAMRFLQSKLSPSPSLLLDLSKGSFRNAVDFTGQKQSVGQAILNRFVPLLAQDAYAVAQQHPRDLPVALATALGTYGVGMWGFGTQTYGSKTPKRRGNYIGPASGGLGGGLDSGLDSGLGGGGLP